MAETKKNLLPLIIGSLLCATSTTGCRRAESHARPIKPVQVEEVKQYTPGEGGETERYSASITPSSQNELAFKYGGYLSEIHQVRGPNGQMRLVQEGDRVAKGTVLARLRPEDFTSKVKQAEAQVGEAQSTTETNRAQLAEAEAALRQAERDFDRATKLLESRSLTRPEWEGARTKVDMALARVDAVKSQAQVIQAKIGGARAILGEAKLAEQDAVLIAPIDCYVLRRLVEPGGLAAPGRPVFVVAERHSVKATFGVPDVTVERLRLGAPLVFSTEAIPGMEFRGWVSRISPAADPKSRVFDVEATIARPPDQLRLGMIASLGLPTGRPSVSMPVIPINAIIRPKQNPENYAVMVVSKAEGKFIAHQRLVKLGDAFGNMIAVTDGLSLGDRIVVSGAALVVDNEEVRVIP